MLRNLACAPRVMVQITDQLFQLIFHNFTKETYREKMNKKSTNIKSNSTLLVGKLAQRLEDFCNVRYLKAAVWPFGSQCNAPLAKHLRSLLCLTSVLDPNKISDKVKGPVFPFLFL